ncbi:hypothetical protein [Sphingobium sp.]|uniref:hypothetical protein n=1 Tax=Sphingobium sp. TaxID=1912891 RepID=UPI002D12A755|nr:hypothetical protein [Sphingobium sp.]HUD92172.1 hypothetical protein [Sphingobium sp.]
MTNNEILVENLSRAIELPEGWHDLYRQLILDISAIDGCARVVDTKEKFGEMRVYLREYSELAFALIDAANARSRSICQICAAPAVLSRTQDGFYATVCSSHANGFRPANFSPLRHVRMVVPKAEEDDQ